MKPNVMDAIKSLDKDAEVTVGGFGTDDITWVGGTTPIPGEEIDAEVIRLQAEYDAQEYARSRALAYDSIGNQLDLLFHDFTAGKGSKTGEWYKAVKKVKTDNPKG